MDGVKLTIARLDSPVGAMLVVCEGEIICALEFVDHSDRMWMLLEKRYGNFSLVEAENPGGACSRLRAYFDGALDAVTDLPVDGGGTVFQRRVWAALRTIPSGTTVSYRDLAARLGIPKAFRAVASANALNPINIVVPCHRVIGVDGALRGYSGGLKRKRWLLQHEGVLLPRTHSPRHE